MAVVSAQTRQTLTAVSGLIQGNLMNKTSADLTKLIGDLGPQELVLASHDIRSLTEVFHKQRRRGLVGELDSRMANVTTPPKTDDAFTVRSPVSPAATEHLLSALASVM